MESGDVVEVSSRQRTGAAIEKLRRRPSMVVLIRGTNRSPGTAEQRERERAERPEIPAIA